MSPMTEQIANARGKCWGCGGSGYVGIDDGITNPKDCSHCNGTGNATFETSEVVEEGRVQPTYPTGHVETWACGECCGSGEYFKCINKNGCITLNNNLLCDSCRKFKKIDCPTCNGKGTLSAEVVGVRVEERECPECRGKKYFCEDYGSGFDCDEENVRCEDCGFSDTCSDCNGSGKVTRIIFTWREKV